MKIVCYNCLKFFESNNMEVVICRNCSQKKVVRKHRVENETLKGIKVKRNIVMRILVGQSDLIRLHGNEENRNGVCLGVLVNWFRAYDQYRHRRYEWRERGLNNFAKRLGAGWDEVVLEHNKIHEVKNSWIMNAREEQGKLEKKMRNLNKYNEETENRIKETSNMGIEEFNLRGISIELLKMRDWKSKNKKEKIRIESERWSKSVDIMREMYFKMISDGRGVIENIPFKDKTKLQEGVLRCVRSGYNLIIELQKRGSGGHVFGVMIVWGMFLFMDPNTGEFECSDRNGVMLILKKHLLVYNDYESFEIRVLNRRYRYSEGRKWVDEDLDNGYEADVEDNV